MNIQIENKEILIKINNTINSKLSSDEEIGLMSGASGVLIFKYLYSNYLNSNIEFEKSNAILENIIKQIENGEIMPSYSNGITGFCFTMQYLSRNKLIDIDENDFFSQFDDYIHSSMLYDISVKNYDFLHGVIGYGFYFYYRFINGNQFKDKYLSYLKEVVDFIDNIKVSSGDLCMWGTFQEKQIENDFNIDLGLAHGVPSIISFLSLLNKSNICTDKTNELINSGINFILSTKLNTKESISLFPTYVNSSGTKSVKNSRLGWCYGDIGIGLTLLRVSKLHRNNSLYELAINILIHSANRRELLSNSINDGGLCHGAYGLFHIYGRLYSETKIQIFSEASDYWNKVGNRMAEIKDDCISYHIHLGDRAWSKPYSFLEGISGIGLAIISNLNNYSDNWDECLLIS